MEITLSVSAEDRADADQSLRGWLAHEPELAGSVTPRLATRPGTLSSASDALLVALGGGGTISVLAASLKSWFNQPRNADVRIEVHDPDGRSVVIDATNVKNADRLIAEVLAARTEGEQAISAP